MSSIADHGEAGIDPAADVWLAVWTVSACYLLVALFVKTPKTTTVIGTIITFFVLYVGCSLLSPIQVMAARSQSLSVHPPLSPSPTSQRLPFTASDPARAASDSSKKHSPPLGTRRLLLLLMERSVTKGGRCRRGV